MNRSKKFPNQSPIVKKNKKKSSLKISPIKKLKKSLKISPIKKKSKKSLKISPIKKSKKSLKISPIQKSKKKRSCTYCGNNLLSPLLQANGGDCILGTNYQCLRKGIGYGMYSPIDLEFINYEPIDPPENIYCGDKRSLPDKYERFGRRSSCLRKGVGIGKRIKIEKEGLL
jgi:hypothetical protein